MTLCHEEKWSTVKRGKSEAAQPFLTIAMITRNEADHGLKGKMMRLLMFVTLGMNEKDKYLLQVSVRKSDDVRSAKLKGLTGSARKLHSMSCVIKTLSW